LSALYKRVESAAREKNRSSEPYRYHFHELRRFSVPTPLAAGVDVRTVSEGHDHAHTTTIRNRYVHALPELRARPHQGPGGSIVA